MKAPSANTSLKHKYFFSIVFLFSIPILIMTVSLVLAIYLSFTSLKSTHEEYISLELYNLGKSGEQKITNIINMMQIIPSNPILAESIFSENITFDNRTVSELGTIISLYNCIDDIYIFNQKSNTVCDTSGIYTADEFYNSRCSYSGYSLNYWKNFRFYNNDSYRILNPTVVSSPGNSQEIIPVVIRKIDNKIADNYVIININLQYLIDYKSMGTSTDFNLYLLNKYTSEVFSSDGMLLKKDFFPSEFYSNLLLGKFNNFEYKHSNGKYLVVSYSPTDHLASYTYFALIPLKGILSKLSRFLWISLGIAFAFSIMAYLLALYNSFKVFSPLYDISKSTNSTQNKNTRSVNLLKDVLASFRKVQDENEQLGATLPYAQERYLINYLNTNEYYIDAETRSIIKQSLKFPYDYFAAVIIQITPTNQMFDLYNSADYENIRIGMYNIIKELFAQNYTCTILPGDNNALYFILNMESKELFSGVNDIFKNIYDLLENDLEYINISIGRSNVHEGFDGLREAHTEALDSLSLHFDTGSHVLLDNSSDTSFKFSHKDESDLFIALTSYNTSDVYALLDNIFKMNNNASPRAKKHLLSNIATVILKAIRIKGISYRNNKLDFEILNELLNQPPKEIKHDIMTLVDYYFSNGDVRQYQNKVNASECIDYIKNNFTFSELSLDFLASHFHTTPSNISTIIKTYLGMGYHEYVTTLRIDAAKDMLINTDKTIDEIFQLCGYSSKQTFYRIFKKTVGLTPLEFRNKNSALS